MYTTRKACPADAEELPAVERSAGRAFLTIPDLAWIAEDDVQSVGRHLELIADGNAWVAVDAGNRPVGFLSAEILGDSLHIWICAVRLEQQRRGIGRALIGCAAASAKQQGITQLSLTTFHDVVWNRPFYERLGFQTLPHGGVPAYLQSILDDEVANGLAAEQRCAMICPFS